MVSSVAYKDDCMRLGQQLTALAAAQCSSPILGNDSFSCIFGLASCTFRFYILCPPPFAYIISIAFSIRINTCIHNGQLMEVNRSPLYLPLSCFYSYELHTCCRNVHRGHSTGHLCSLYRVRSCTVLDYFLFSQSAEPLRLARGLFVCTHVCLFAPLR